MTKQAWFLTGSQGLYSEETLCGVAEQSQAVVDGLAKARLTDTARRLYLTGYSVLRLGLPPC